MNEVMVKARRHWRHIASGLEFALWAGLFLSTTRIAGILAGLL